MATYPALCISTLAQADQDRQEEKRPKATLTLPYISNLSEAIRWVLAPLNIQVVFRPLMTLRQLLVHPNDQVPMDERKGVVYSITCTVRPKVYIGQTDRSLKQWLKEHWRALRHGDVAASALAEHALVAGHGIDLSKAEVLGSNPYTATWCMFGSWHIQHSEDKLNRERGNLPEVYAALLDWTFTLRHYIWTPSHYTDTLHILATCIISLSLSAFYSCSRTSSSVSASQKKKRGCWHVIVWTVLAVSSDRGGLQRNGTALCEVGLLQSHFAICMLQHWIAEILWLWMANFRNGYRPHFW